MRQKGIDRQVAGRQIQAQIEIAERQLQGQILAERERELWRKTEEAYARLGDWLYELERIIDEVVAGASESEDAVTQRATSILKDWP